MVVLARCKSAHWKSPYPWSARVFRPSCTNSRAASPCHAHPSWTATADFETMLSRSRPISQDGLTRACWQEDAFQFRGSLPTTRSTSQPRSAVTFRS